MSELRRLLVRSCRNASSRFGPTVPFVPAWERAWQDPHFCTNSCLPLTRFGESCLSVQPVRTTATRAPNGSSLLGVRAVRGSALAIGGAALYPRPRRGDALVQGA